MINDANSNPVLKFIKNDDYYCFLVPLICPLSVLILYINWVCLKFFRHS